MKVIFLDIDGVLNNNSTRQRHRGFIGIDPYLVAKLNRIVLEMPEVKYVLSSSWRCFKHGREEVERCFIEMYDETPQIHEAGRVRGDEIKAWLDAHPEVEKYAIIDDDSDMLEEQLPNFFKTTWQEGITEEIVGKIIEHFK
jgi:hypothetical protein